MSTSELKFDLVKLIIDSNDADLLQFMRSLFQLAGHESDWWATIPESERQLILEGRAQLAAGAGVPHEAVREKVSILFEKLATGQ